MKIRELVEQWEAHDKGRLTRREYAIPLTLEDAARLAALGEMYPKRQLQDLLGDLVSAALDELEGSFPYVQGSKVVATDELGDPLYEDIGQTPRYLALSRKHLAEMIAANKAPPH
ncbi:pilin assembly protein [Atopomonas sediminilitoris]|uniref:pilin assembly protein n=1 Tax=Atopomonas sediminilitoris TaxID=2919919 RepID=UPI001F4D5F82|nr:pilin assembly protein [Atopomonas sediminilitoris]MCJ8168889.1 pilin assembly protein [Atopomonas sediminilitoris]